jgi:hypothetical protein
VTRPITWQEIKHMRLQNEILGEIATPLGADKEPMEDPPGVARMMTARR